MLNPNDRTLYLDALRPPAGYELDYTIVTTYSLNLTTLIILPLALSKYRYDYDSLSEIDEIQLLEALENNYKKINIFCQKGEIKIPKNINILYGFLEDTIIESVIKEGTKSFHPKIWLLRFRKEKDFKYRLIVLSRNITFDKSWDTILVLEGEKSSNIVEENKELKNFILSLINSSDVELKKSRRNKIKKLADEIMRIKFKTIQGFDEYLDFKTLGTNSKNNWPFKFDYDRVLIISPFLSSTILNKFKGNNNVLISQETEINKNYNNIRENFSKIYSIDYLFENESSEDNYNENFHLRSGLHAKIYLFEIQENNTIYLYTGSPNATNAAFNGNIEFMVGLRKTNSDFNIESLINSNQEEKFDFSKILSEYIPPENNENETEDLVEKKIRECKRKLLNLNLFLKIDERQKNNKKIYNLSLHSKDEIKHLFENDEVDITCWPVTRSKEKGYQSFLKFTSVDALKFYSLTINTLTSFIAFEIKIKSNSTTFVSNLPIKNNLTKRKENILTKIISDQNKFIKFLYLLLKDKDQFIRTNQNYNFGFGNNKNRNNNFMGFPLMEDILNALTDKVKLIDRIERIVNKIEKSDQSRIPSEFYKIWNTIMEVRREEIEEL